MNKIYIVTEEWMNEGEGGCTPHPFTTWEKAKEFYDWCIEKELDEYLAAAPYADDDIDETENGTDNTKRYRIEKVENKGGTCVWTFYEKGNYNDFHSAYNLDRFVVDYDWSNLCK